MRSAWANASISMADPRSMSCSLLIRILVAAYAEAGPSAKRRANAVANYLQQQAGVAPGRVRAGDGMGVAPDAGNGSNANARKVVVKLVVDKGVQAGKAK